MTKLQKTMLNICTDNNLHLLRSIVEKYNISEADAAILIDYADGVDVDKQDRLYK